MQSISENKNKKEIISVKEKEPISTPYNPSHETYFQRYSFKWYGKMQDLNYNVSQLEWKSELSINLS